MIRRILIKKTGLFRYDPIEMIIDKVTRLYPAFEPRHDEGVLDPIPAGLAGRIDLSRFLSAPDTSPLGRAARLIMDPSFTHVLMKTDSPKLAYAPSAKIYRKFVSEMISADLCVKSRSRPRGFAKFFTVLKKTGDDGIPILRTILDCRTANESFVQPDPVNLPLLTEMLTEFANVECMKTLDLRHMYHQIRLGTHLTSYFTVAMGSLRLSWRVLPMGWTWACFVAQAITTYAVAGDTALSWTEVPRVIRKGRCSFFVVYDNVLAGGPKEELEKEWDAIVRRLQNPDGINAIIKEEATATVGNSLMTLGLEWFPSVAGLEWCFLPKFVEKLKEMHVMLESSTWVTAKDIAGCLGLVAWGRYATLDGLFDVIGDYKSLADVVAQQGWSGRDEARKYTHVMRALQELQAVGKQRHHKDVEDEVLVYTDAHVSGFGYVGGHPLVTESRRWDRVFNSKDMYYLEAISLKQAVSMFAVPARKIHIVSDNLGLVHAMRKRSTACPRTGQILAEAHALLRQQRAQIVVHWIPTDFNPADELSRGDPLDRDKLEEALGHVVWTVPPEPLWGSHLGRVVGATAVGQVGCRGTREKMQTDNQ